MGDIDVRNAGAAPIISNICKELKICETINDSLEWEPQKCLLSPGTFIEAMIVNILCRENPFYQLEDFYKEQDVELIFGKGVTANNFNDDLFAYTLDKISAANPRKVFSLVVRKALTEEKLSDKIIRSDSNVCLSYDIQGHPEGLPIFSVYNGERGQELKQIRMGLAVTNDGFPIWGEVLDAELREETWKKKLLNFIAEYSNGDRLKENILVTDSSFVTKDILEFAKDKCIFISGVANTFSLASELSQEAYDKGEWLHLGSIPLSKKNVIYKLQEFTRELYGQQYRFLVVHSNQIDKRKLNGLAIRLKKQKLELEKEAARLMKVEFTCESEGQGAFNSFLRDYGNSFYPITYVLEQKHNDIFKLNLEIGELNEEAYKVEQDKLGCFILISNVPHDYNGNYSAFDILKEYKSQSVNENSFSFLKSPVYLNPLWIKNNDRLESLCYVILMALAVYIVLQKRVRDILINEEEPLELVGRVKSFSPTGQRLLQLFSEVKIVFIKDNTLVKRILPDRYLKLEKALKMIGFDLSIYTIPRFF